MKPVGKRILVTSVKGKKKKKLNLEDRKNC